MLDEIIFNIFIFLNPTDIIHYCSTNRKNRFYKKNSIIWKKLFMRDYYYPELNLKMGYANIFFVRDHEVDYIDGPERGWLNQYKYCHIRHQVMASPKNEYLLRQLRRL